MNLANNLTVLRILLVPIFVGTLLYYSPEKIFLKDVGVIIFVFACLTDALDGYLARRMNQTTALGSYIDPIADKLLLLSGFLSLSLMTHLPPPMKIPAWVTIPVISRDVIILIGSTLIFVTTGHLKARPLWIGKLTTVSQMCALLLSLIMAPKLLQLSFFALTVALTVVSGILYIRLGGKLLQTT